MPTITDIRAQYPQYNDMSDSQLADSLYSAHYSDMPRDQFNAKIGFQAEPQAPAQDQPPAPQVGTAEDMAKSGASGLVQGITGLAGLPGDVGSLASAATDKLGSMVGALPDAIKNFKDIASNAIQAVPGMAPFAKGPTSSQLNNALPDSLKYQPQTTAGHYAQTVGQFAPAVIGGPEAIGTKLLTRVAAPAIASEGAGQLTQGTAAEPYARIAGALVGAGGSSAIANKLTQPALEAAPSMEQLAQHKDALYSSPEIAAVQVKPTAMQSFVGDLDKQLLNAKVDKFVAPTVSGILDRLQTPRFGPTGTVQDFDLARQSLKDVPYTESRAAGIVRNAIDKYLGNIPQTDLAAGDAAAANAKLLEARATVAAMKRAEDVTKAMGRAENQAGSTYSGGNIENATRQQLRPILNQKQGVAKGNYFKDYTPAEIAALKNAVVGTTPGNAVRAIGKYLGGGGGLGALGTAVAAGAAAHEVGADPWQAMGIGFMSGLAGKGFNKLGNRMATNRAAAVDEMLRMRSPLGAPIAARNAQILGMMPSISHQISMPALLALHSQLQQYNSR